MSKGKHNGSPLGQNGNLGLQCRGSSGGPDAQSSNVYRQIRHANCPDHESVAESAYDSRTAPEVAEELHLDAPFVRVVFEDFPCFFRRSRRTDSNVEHYFSVHARYARRLPKAPGGNRPPTPTLEPEELSSMFDLITNMVKNGSQRGDLEQRNRTLFITTVVTMIAALIAARASIASAVIKGSS